MEYIIGFDLNRNMVRLLNPATMEYEELPTHRTLVARGDYAAMIKFATRERSISGADVRVVLPDTAMACDFFTIPTIKNTKNAMKVEFENYYTNFDKLKYNVEDYNMGKKHSTSMYVMVRRSLIDSLEQGLEDMDCNVKGITSAPNAVANAFLAMGGKLTNVSGTAGGAMEIKSGLSFFKKKKADGVPRNAKEPLPNSVLFVDVQRHMCRMVLSAKSTTLCSLFQPFGYDMLHPNKVVQEYMLTNHDVAELAVLNAVETAKRKKQTVAISNDVVEDDADDDYMEMLEALTNKDGAPLPKRKKAEEEDNSAEYFDDPEEKKEEQTATTPSEPKPFDKVAKKVEKKYPKFMLRDRPVGEENFVMENFRTIQKYILLFVQNMELSSTFSRPERVVINLPPEYSYVVSRLNEEGDNGIEFALLANESGVAAAAVDNLDLYGATLMERFNKAHNF